MEIRTTTKEVGFGVRDCVFSHFGVSGDKLYTHGHTRALNAAKMYLYLIMHKDYGISIGQIALFCEKSTRNIQACVAKMRYQIGQYAECADEYESLVEKVRERLSGQDHHSPLT